MVQQAARTIALCVLAFPSSALPRSNQLVPREDTQIWSDVQASHSLREDTDLLLHGLFRLGRDASPLVYERVGMGLSFKLGKYITLSPLYSYLATQPVAGQDSRENRISLEATVGRPLGRWIVSDRNLIESALPRSQGFNALSQSRSTRTIDRVGQRALEGIRF